MSKNEMDDNARDGSDTGHSENDDDTSGSENENDSSMEFDNEDIESKSYPSGSRNQAPPIVALSTTNENKSRRAKVRDLLVLREINNDRLPTMLPPTCDLIFSNPNELHIFKIKVTPAEGFWKGGIFFFDVTVPEGYNFEPPKVKCATKIWHPNITEDGAVCLSILRSGAIDETGWNPARQLKDVVLGINSLFTDLVNFHDALNNEAADMFTKDPRGFAAKVLAYIREYAQKPTP